MPLKKTVKTRNILADGFQITGKLEIGNHDLFERWLNKNYEYDRKETIDEIIFEMVEIKNGRKREKF